MRESLPSSPSQDRRYRLSEGQRGYLIYPPPGSILEGRPLIPPQNRANLIMGNTNASPATTQPQQQPRSNLSVLLEHQNRARSSEEPSQVARAEASGTAMENEADSASGPSIPPAVHANSAPSSVGRTRVAPPAFLPVVRTNSMEHRRLSTGDVTSLRPVGAGTTPPTRRDKSVRR